MLTLMLALLSAVEPIPRGAPGRTVAVLEFESQLAPGETVDRIYFSDKVRGDIARLLPAARVMTRENVVQLLAASGKKLEDCTGECEVETGRLLGADMVVSGRLTKVGTRFKLSLRLHATKDASLLSTATASGETVDKLDDASADAVADLLATIAPVAREGGAPGTAQGPPPTVFIVETVPPGARVLIDGRERGTSPLSVEGLAPGRHALRLELVDHLSAEQEVNVKAAQTGKARVALQRLTGRLMVESAQAARCSAGDQERSIAEGGMEAFELPVGSQEVRCSASGYQPFSERVMVKAGQTARVHATLERVEEAPPPQPTRAVEFSDWRIGALGGVGAFSAGASNGSVRDSWLFKIDHVWSSGLPGLLWSIGVDFDISHSDLVTTSSTLYANAASLGLGYGFPFTPRFQIELLPYVELVGAAINHPYSSSTAWGAGGGFGGRLTLAYTFDSLVQISVLGGYSLRWLSLSGDSGYKSDVTAQLAAGGVSLGKRF